MQIIIPDKIARLKLYPGNKALIVWLVLNKFNLDKNLEFSPNLISIKEQKVTMMATQFEYDFSYISPLWDLTDLFDMPKTPEWRSNAKIKLYRRLTKKFIAPEYLYDRYIKYRPQKING